MQHKDLNSLIPIDDLYWDEISKQYTVFSDEQLERLCIMGVEQGLNTEELHLAINTFVQWKVNSKILERIFEGQLYFKVENNEVVIGYE
jgi:hypothetical protein